MESIDNINAFLGKDEDGNQIEIKENDVIAKLERVLYPNNYNIIGLISTKKGIIFALDDNGEMEYEMLRNSEQSLASQHPGDFLRFKAEEESMIVLSRSGYDRYRMHMIAWELRIAAYFEVPRGFDGECKIMIVGTIGQQKSINYHAKDNEIEIFPDYESARVEVLKLIASPYKLLPLQLERPDYIIVGE